jgi:flagellar biosynthesis component FlhA
MGATGERLLASTPPVTVVTVTLTESGLLSNVFTSLSISLASPGCVAVTTVSLVVTSSMPRGAFPSFAVLMSTIRSAVMAPTPSVAEARISTPTPATTSPRRR